VVCGGGGVWVVFCSPPPIVANTFGGIVGTTSYGRFPVRSVSRQISDLQEPWTLFPVQVLVNPEGITGGKGRIRAGTRSEEVVGRKENIGKRERFTRRCHQFQKHAAHEALCST